MEMIMCLHESLCVIKKQYFFQSYGDIKRCSFKETLQKIDD